MSILFPQKRSILTTRGNLAIAPGAGGSAPPNPDPNITRFNPTTISNLFLWLDSSYYSSISATGSNVTQWKDKSGNNINFNVVTTGSITVDNTTFAYHSININSPASVNAALKASNAASAWKFLADDSTDWTITALVNSNAGNGTNLFILGDCNQTVGTGFRLSNAFGTSVGVGAFSSGSSQLSFFGSGFTTDHSAAAIVTVVYTASNDTATLYKGTTSVASGTLTAVTSDPDSSLILGQSADAAKAWNGNFAALYVWKHALSGGELSSMVTAVTSQWNL